MSLVRWDPFRELEDMSTRLNRIFNRPTEGKELMRFADWFPAVDIQETNEEYVIKAELPEIPKEDLKVTVKEGVLAIEGERKQEKEEKGKKFHRIERSYGTFFRSFTLPEDVNAEKLIANYKDGLLMLRLPKAPVAKPKAIEVKVG
ncbi:MAG: Hsp20/alpha crystallin family protein [Deltaproteobacteria bacterium]|nr:Hsp20/alpha crystallin family protein [Deltaproteobacteria bacterium]